VTERMGLEWGPVRNGAAELADIDRPVVEHFSQRRHEMIREAERGGIGLGSKSAAEHAALATRERKRYGLETHTWREEVRARAGEQGLDTDSASERTARCRCPVTPGVSEPATWTADNEQTGGRQGTRKGLRPVTRTKRRSVLGETSFWFSDGMRGGTGVDGEYGAPRERWEVVNGTNAP
jgi:TrwC relaxase